MTDKLLELAIEIAGEGSEIASKLKAGEPLSDYELHLTLEVHILHYRLGGIDQRHA